MRLSSEAASWLTDDPVMLASFLKFFLSSIVCLCCARSHEGTVFRKYDTLVKALLECWVGVGGGAAFYKLNVCRFIFTFEESLVFMCVCILVHSPLSCMNDLKRHFGGQKLAVLMLSARGSFFSSSRVAALLFSSWLCPGITVMVDWAY